MKTNQFRASFITLAGVFITYFAMYAFRKPFTALSYEGMEVFGFNYKVAIVIAHTFGYLVSKWIGVKYISEMSLDNRIYSIVALIGISWVALLLFAVIPPPYNFFILFINGLPLGLIWGIVFSFIEGKEKTELFATFLSCSFILASGFVKSSGLMIIEYFHVNTFWMPFYTGLLYIPALILGIILLKNIPKPSQYELGLKSERLPMNNSDRKKFFKTFWPGIILTVTIFMALTAFRDLRDNFSIDLYHSLHIKNISSWMSISELVVSIFVMAILSLLIFIKNNKYAFNLNLLIILFSGLGLIFTNILYESFMISGYFWIIGIGLFSYIAYIAFHVSLFDRWIATFKLKGNIGFLMYIADSAGYLSSFIILIFKEELSNSLTWINFFKDSTFITGLIMISLSFLSWLYFTKISTKSIDCEQINHTLSVQKPS